MSNKFNEYGSGGDGGDATNGSLDIWGYSLRATNMDNNSAIKTNGIGQLISSKLNISDVNNLQNELDATIQNPNNSVLVTDGLTITTGNILKTDEIHESTLGTNINLANDLYTTNVVVTGGNEIKTNNIGEASLGGGMNILSNLDMNSNDISNVASINGLTPVGGIYSGISDGATITQAMGTSGLFPTSSVGTLSVPANGFSVGSAYHLVCSGIFPSENKNDDVEIELCAELADTTVVVLGSILIGLENFDTAPSNFELESDFVIRSVGLTGQVAVSFDFTFNKKVTADFKGTRATNLATLDTTQAASLQLNATITGGNGSTIKSTLAYLRRQY